MKVGRHDIMSFYEEDLIDLRMSVDIFLNNDSYLETTADELAYNLTLKIIEPYQKLYNVSDRLVMGFASQDVGPQSYLLHFALLSESHVRDAENTNDLINRLVRYVFLIMIEDLESAFELPLHMISSNQIGDIAFARNALSDLGSHLAYKGRARIAFSAVGLTPQPPNCEAVTERFVDKARQSATTLDELGQYAKSEELASDFELSTFVVQGLIRNVIQYGRSRVNLNGSCAVDLEGLKGRQMITAQAIRINKACSTISWLMLLTDRARQLHLPSRL